MTKASDVVAVESSVWNRTCVVASRVGITDVPSESTNAIRIRFCPSSTRSKRNLIAKAHWGCVTGASFAFNRSNEPRMFNLPPASIVAASHNVKISTFIPVSCNSQRKQLYQVGNFNAILFHRIALAEGDGVAQGSILFSKCLKIDCYTKRCPNLVLTAIASSNR